MNNTQPKIEALYRAPEDLPAVAATPKKASGLLFLMPSFINHRKLPPVEQALGVVFQEPHSEWRLAPTICPRNRHRRHCTPPPPPSLYLPLPPPRHRPLPPPVPRNDILHTPDVATLPLVFDACIAELHCIWCDRAASRYCKECWLPLCSEHYFMCDRRPSCHYSFCWDCFDDHVCSVGVVKLPGNGI